MRVTITANRPGEACAAGNECLSGYCVDGVCCDSACGWNAVADTIATSSVEAGVCQACTSAKGATADGACTTVNSSERCENGTSDLAERLARSFGGAVDDEFIQARLPGIHRRVARRCCLPTPDEASTL